MTASMTTSSTTPPAGSTLSAATIGTTIRNLRRQRDMTQEQLAEYLGITSRAVSQWECGRTAPDIAQLPVLANVFEVSADVLLGIDTGAKEKTIRTAIREAQALASRGHNKEASALLRPRLKEYPDSCRLMRALMDSLFNERLTLEDAAKKEMTEEILRLGEKILETCTEDEIRHHTIQTLCILYPETGETQRPLALAEKMPDAYCDRDSLLRYVYTGANMGRKRFDHIRCEFCNTINGLVLQLCYNNAPLEDGSRPYTAEEMVLLREKYFAVMEILFEDQNYGFYSCQLSTAHEHQAYALAKLGRLDEALAHLRTAADFAVEHDVRFDPKEGTYTCLLLRNMAYETPYYGSSENLSMTMLERLQDRGYDPLRKTDAFSGIEATLKETAGYR